MTRFNFYEHHQYRLLLQHATGLNISVKKRDDRSEAHFELTGFVGGDGETDDDNEDAGPASQKGIDGFDFARNPLDDFQNCAKGDAL